jgi:long-subunit fatty acid transport protein
LLVATGASALTDEEVFRGLRFSSAAVPGARALAMGGAYIGRADDATASFVNPAGLGFLDRPQAMIDVRVADVDDRHESNPGTFDLYDDLDDPIGVETFASGLRLFEEEAFAQAGFVGYVHPVTDYLVIAAGRHERLSFERDVLTTFSSTAFRPLEDGGSAVVREALESRGTLDVLMETYDLSIASAIIEQLSLGLTVSLARLDMVSTLDNFQGRTADTDSDDSLDSFLTLLDYRTVVDDEDTAFTFSAGLLYRPHEKVGIGLVYRDGPEFDLIEEVTGEGARAAALREYLASPLPNGVVVANNLGQFVNRVTIPDSYGAGLSLGPWFEDRGGGGLLITADAVRVEYSDILDSFVAGLNNQLFASDSQGVVFALDDGTEYHLGVGWTWTVGYNNSIHVRAGVYSEPDRQVLSSGRLTGVVNPGTGTLVRAGEILDEDDDEIHVTAGAGFTLKRGFYSFELDGAADISDLGNVYTGSAIFKF